LIEDLRIGHVYLLDAGNGIALVDGGTAGDAERIVAQLEGAGYDPAAVRAILVTHAHADHIGGVPKLVRRLGAQVWAHRAEVPYVEGTETMPVGLSWFQRAMQWLGKLLPGGGSKITVDRALEDGEVLGLLGGLRVIHTPGHTPGSVCLYQEERGVLFCGDLLFNGNPLTGRGGLQYAPATFSVDPAQVKRSAQRLADLRVRALCVGHGEPILREPAVRMEALLAEARG
jgi:glyoxylase-like metal-dependent hydrolase (beta-lactamase superfamily II)